MIKSIKFKLWLTFLLTFVISMMSMLLLTHASVKKGFLDYTSELAVERLSFLEAEVLNIYAKEKSLDTLKDNQRLWRKLKNYTFQKYAQKQKSEGTSPSSAAINTNQKAFIDHLILTHPNKGLIVGRQLHKQEYSWMRLEHEQIHIGFIGYIKPKDFLRSVDKLFVQQQLRAFAIISIAMIVVSFLISLFVSRWLVSPLDALSINAKKLISGDFSAQIKYTSLDELGELCRNFNELAHTLSSNEHSRRQWVADISHEMRTPLSVIKAQIEAMQDGIRKTDQENLGLLKDKIDSLNVLINDLYELSLSDLGALNYNKEKFSIENLVMQVAEGFEDKVNAKKLGYTVNNRLEMKDAVFGDANRITQLIHNLLENSLRYTDNPGEIVLTAQRNQENIQIHIEDSAPGVPEDKLEKIFNRLYRLESSRNRATGGAGLGLSICKNIVDAHKGSVTAAPSRLGGLHVTIELPRQRL